MCFWFHESNKGDDRLKNERFGKLINLIAFFKFLFRFVSSSSSSTTLHHRLNVSFFLNLVEIFTFKNYWKSSPPMEHQTEPTEHVVDTKILEPETLFVGIKSHRFEFIRILFKFFSIFILWEFYLLRNLLSLPKQHNEINCAILNWLNSNGAKAHKFCRVHKGRERQFSRGLSDKHEIFSHDKWHISGFSRFRSIDHQNFSRCGDWKKSENICPTRFVLIFFLLTLRPLQRSFIYDIDYWQDDASSVAGRL